METVSTKPQQITSLQPLLRRKKYYVKAISGACTNCSKGENGCCVPNLRLVWDDFQMDCTEENIRTLLELGVFNFYSNLRTNVCHFWDFTTELRIRTRMFRGQEVCLFWSAKGCRLAYDAKPRVCRTYSCHDLRDGMKEFNKRDKKRSVGYRTGRQLSLQEKLLFVRIALDYVEEDKFDVVTMKEYKSFDWEHILMTLQGNL